MSWIDSEGLPLGDRVNPPELTWLRNIIKIEDYEQRQAEFTQWSLKHLVVAQSRMSFDDLEYQKLRSGGQFERYFQYCLKRHVVNHTVFLTGSDRLTCREIEDDEVPGKQFRVTTCHIAPEKGIGNEPVSMFGDDENDQSFT